MTQLRGYLCKGIDIRIILPHAYAINENEQYRHLLRSQGDRLCILAATYTLVKKGRKKKEKEKEKRKQTKKA